MTSKEKGAGYQLRNFVFTWNNPGKYLLEQQEESEEYEKDDCFYDDLFDVETLREEKAKAYINIMFSNQTLPIQFITYGIEHGEKGTHHFQGYCELARRITFDRVKKHFGGCHIEPRHGTQQQAIDYCRKGGNYISLGEPKVQGNRSDLQHIKSMLDVNSSIKTLLKEGVIDSAQGLRLAQNLLRYTDVPRDYKPKVLWFYGDTETGKTREARSLLPHAYFKTNLSEKWWPNYDGEEDIIIDDLTPDRYPFITMLGLLDRYPYQVEDKGTIREFKGRNIIVTCTSTPRIIYAGTEYQGSMNQLERRIDEMREFT